MAQNQSGATGAPARQGGPASYAIPVAEPVQSAGGGYQFQPVRAGVSGVGGFSPSRAAGGDFASAPRETVSTINRIVELGQGILRPHLEAQAQQAYFNGMNKVVQGQTLSQILADKPWYTRIFGDGAMIEGARAYTIQKAVLDHSTRVNEQMPELRKRPTDQVVSELTAQFDQYRTGDAATDALLLKAATDTLPQVIQRHTREHYAYNQENMTFSMSEAINSAASNLQRTASGVLTQMTSPEEMEAQRQAMLQVVTPPAGMDPEAYAKVLETEYVRAAQGGNWHAIKFIRDSGILARVPPDRLRIMEDQTQRHKARYKAEIENGPFAQSVAEFDMLIKGPGADIHTVRQMADTINGQFRSYTGLDEDLIDVASSMAQGGLVQWRNEQTEANSPAARKANDMPIAKQRFLAGGGAFAKQGLSLDSFELDSQFMEAYTETEDKIGFIVNNTLSGYESPRLASEIRMQVAPLLEGQPYTANFQQTYQLWKGIYEAPNGGVVTAEKYFPPAIHNLMRQFDSRVKSFPPGAEVPYDSLHDEFFSTRALNRAAAEVPEADIGEYARHITDVGLVPGFFGRIINNVPDLTDGAKRKVAQYTYHTYQQTGVGNAGADPRVRARQAMVHTAGLEAGGRYAWVRDPKDVPLSAFLPNTALIPKVLDTVVKDSLTRHGITSYEHLDLNRGEDTVDGQPQFFLQAIREDGTAFYDVIRGETVKAHYNEEVRLILEAGRTASRLEQTGSANEEGRRTFSTRGFNPQGGR